MLQKFWGAKERNEKWKIIMRRKKVRKIVKIKEIKKEREREKWEGNKFKVKK
jgi:hypothetical protein